MKILIGVTAAITEVFGALMIWFSFVSFFNRPALAFLFSLLSGIGFLI